MKLITVILSVILVSASGYLIKVPIVPQNPLVPNTDWIHRQKLILSFFNNVCDLSNDPLIVRLSQEFDFDTLTTKFDDPNVVINLQNLISGRGLLPKGEIFTEYNKDHFGELKIISELLISAPDFDTFLKAAAWARQNVNCGLFVDAIYMTITKRRDTEKLSVPAPYELLPNYFIKKDAIITGSALVTGIPINPSDSIRNDGNAYIIEANYTSEIFDNDDETKLAYFNEDIGLNSYYFLKKLSKISWLNDLKNDDSRYGEYVYHIMKQLATRYDLERYSNGFQDVEEINWDMPNTVTYYDPMLIYSNGNDFGSRLKITDFSNTEEYTLLKNIEQNIATVVSHMRQSGYDKRLILNNLMEILVTGDKNYEGLSHQLLKNVSNYNNGSLSVLEHYITSLRDPTFWKINKKIVNLIETALSGLPTYAKNELYFPGVEIVNIDIKKMSTYWENFEFDSTDALKSTESDSVFQVKMSQPRLNHKAFTMKVNISSLVTQKGLLKIYLGPKMLPGELVSKKNKFMLLDMFEFNLKKGNNIISRSSEELMGLSGDFMSLKTLYNNVENAEFGVGTLPLNDVEKFINFPSRLIIPKGAVEGLPLQIFVFIAPFAKVSIDAQGLTTTDFNTAVLSPGYPLDLNIENWQLFDLPNVIIKEVIVAHKEANKAGNYEGKGSYFDSSSKKWGGSNSYDYSKKGQYGQDTDYASKPYERLSFNKENKFIPGNQSKQSGEKDVAAFDIPNNQKSNETSDAKNINKVGDFFDDIDKKVDKAVLDFFNTNNKSETLTNHLNHPLLQSTKKIEKYKDGDKSQKTDQKDTVISEVTGVYKNESNRTVENGDIKSHTTDVTLDIDQGFGSKVISKNFTKDVTNPIFHSTDIKIGGDGGSDVTLDIDQGFGSKVISKNFTNGVTNPIFHSTDIKIGGDGGSDVTLDIDQGFGSKVISKNFTNGVTNPIFHSTDIKIGGDGGSDVTLDIDQGFGSKVISKNFSKDVTKPIFYSTDVKIGGDDSSSEKNVVKNNSIKIPFFYPKDINIDKKWSKTTSKSDSDLTDPTTYSDEITINNNDKQWTKTIHKTPSEMNIPFTHTTIETTESDKINTRVPINKENRPTLYDYGLYNYFDYQEPVYE